MQPISWSDAFNPIHTDIFYNLFISCGVINDPMYIVKDLPIKVKFLSNAFILLTLLKLVNVK